MDPSPPSLSVIVCSAARPHLVAGCVTSLLEHTGWREGDEALVVLNGAGRDEARTLIAREVHRHRPDAPRKDRENDVDDDTLGGLADESRGAHDPGSDPGGVERTTIDGWTLAVHRSEQRGVSRARNLGAALARGELLIYLDDDARPRPGWLDAWRAAFAADPNLSAAGGPIVPSWPGATPRWFHPRIGPYWAMLDARDSGEPVPPGDRAYGANMGLRAEAVANVGGFRTDIGWGSANPVAGEESDLLVRLHATGHQLGWVPDAVVDHLVEPERNSVRYLVRRAFVQGRTDVALGTDRPAPWAPVTTGWRTLVRSLRNEPTSWRATAAVDLARRARLAGRWRATATMARADDP